MGWQCLSLSVITGISIRSQAKYYQRKLKSNNLIKIKKRSSDQTFFLLKEERALTFLPLMLNIHDELSYAKHSPLL